MASAVPADQARAPLFEALRGYAALENKVAFHTPGHKQGRGMAPEFRSLVGPATLRLDLTELDELDDLHHPEGVIQEAQALAAQAFGADGTFFLVNGTNAGHHAMIAAVCDPGDKLIIPRHAPESVMGGLILSGARPAYMRPVWDPALALAHGVTPETVEAALTAHPDAKGVLLVHPTPFGAVSDLRRIAELCHAHGKPLLVDETHGAHLRFHPALPISGMEAGADMVVQSTHKTLSGLAQAAMLHVREGRVRANRVRSMLAIVQSSSPSYLLMASLDTARRQMATSGYRLLSAALALANDARRRLNEIPGVFVFGPEQCRPGGLFDLDVTRLTVHVTGLGLTGFEASRQLNEAFDVQPETATLHHVLLSVSIGHGQRDLDRVVEAFEAMSQARGILGQAAALPMPEGVPLTRLTPREAFFAQTEAIPFEASAGRVCAELVAADPAGLVILAPGEVVTAELITYWRALQDMGAACSRTLKVVRP